MNTLLISITKPQIVKLVFLSLFIIILLFNFTITVTTTRYCPYLVNFRFNLFRKLHITIKLIAI